MHTDSLIELHNLWCNLKTEKSSYPSLLSRLVQNIKNLFNVKTSYIFISHSTNIESNFISAKALEILGYPIRPINMLTLLNKIQADDFAYFLDSEAFLTIFNGNKLIRKMKKYTSIFDYQVKNTDFDSNSIFEEFTVIEINDNHAILNSLTSHRSIKHLKFLNNPRLSLIGHDGQASFINIEGKKTIY